MPKYLLEVNYTLDGLKGVMKDGGAKRKAAAASAAKSAGGKVDAFYFAFGGTDVFVIADFPDNQSAAALALAVSSAGGASVKTTVFGSRSMMWRIDKEAALFLGAGRALLLQLAHPWVAAAITQHLTRMAGFQEAWASRMTQPPEVGSHP